VLQVKGTKRGKSFFEQGTKYRRLIRGTRYKNPIAGSLPRPATVVDHSITTIEGYWLPDCNQVELAELIGSSGK
jgi:hypothetical protein